MNKHSYALWSVLLITTVCGTSVKAESTGKDILDKQCISCHAITQQTPQSLKALWERKGPDLSSAGIKYKAEWLKVWLQNPSRIRLAGMFYGNHIKLGKKLDEVDQASLVKHPQLSSEDASQVSEELMTLKQNQVLVTAGDYKPGTISMTLGDMMFDKFKGCLACHQIEPGYGGISGSEMYTAGSRLQEDYLISFMRNPQAWDPKTIMPNKHLKEIDLQKLVHYLRALAKETI
ncbi:MAG: c-type cytochrome [Methylococcales bacterium]|nr:c-type cytochrome [Methylococcales bacterium]